MKTTQGGTVRRITDRCFQLDHSRGANGYVVVGEGRAAVIDPGLASGFAKLLRELRDSESQTGPITDIVLTHYDPDHSGAAARLQRELDVPVWIGAADAEILSGEKEAPSGARRFMSALSRVKNPAGVRELTAPAGEPHHESEVFPGLTVIPTPGHTPGHVALQWGPVLFVGDAVSVSKDGALRQFSMGPLIADKTLAMASEAVLNERIAATDVEWVCAGHNPPARVIRALAP
ncbi:MBL fold metallo-hydrolase [Herbiconiux ginsengi]|uniref:Glyoxylase, beta-lactamase superfamily II n=1 Tax=Herbiconiux ginsengi TaxID=381665 RepID=A0A1H3KW02_9MICO|nr:MBL fold metallo-hydrolase [Herbiconiux ginsengi]SDY55855.1 Glyoxylase, beta-lactamase superfamily II [Herbiconiux ginsengi]